MKRTTDEIQKLGEMIKDSRVAMLTTMTSDGQLRSRPMATQRTPFDGDLWFFTSKSSGKVHELADDAHVNLSYAEPEPQKYVSISGRANLVDDRHKAEELWNSSFKTWFPLGLDDPDLSLLKVTVEAAEYWDTPSGGMARMFGLVTAMAGGEPYEPNEHEKVKL